MKVAPLIMSFGQTRLIVYRNLVEFGVKLPLAIVGLLQFGLMGIVAARLVSELAAVGVSIVLVRRLAGISASAQVVVCWRSVAASLAMALPVVALRSAMPAPMDAPSAAITLAVLVATGAGVYLVTLWLLWLVSGRPAGIEAMLHKCPVVLCGQSDFHHCAVTIRTSADMDAGIAQAIAGVWDFDAFIYWYFGLQCLNTGSATLVNDLIGKIRATGYEL